MPTQYGQTRAKDVVQFLYTRAKGYIRANTRANLPGPCEEKTAKEASEVTSDGCEVSLWS